MSLDPADILRTLPDGVVTVGADRLVDYVNPRAARLLGRDESDLVGITAREALPFVEPGGNNWWTLPPHVGGGEIRESLTRLPH